jgi:hypothetical protein
MTNGAKDGHLTNTSPCHISIAKKKKKYKHSIANPDRN